MLSSIGCVLVVDWWFVRDELPKVQLVPGLDIAAQAGGVHVTRTHAHCSATCVWEAGTAGHAHVRWSTRGLGTGLRLASVLMCVCVWGGGGG